jgi:hypothetical protein
VAVARLRAGCLWAIGVLGGIKGCGSLKSDLRQEQLISAGNTVVFQVLRQSSTNELEGHNTTVFWRVYYKNNLSHFTKYYYTILSHYYAIKQ